MASNTVSDESKMKILLETVMWGSIEDVQETLDSQGLILDDRYTDYAMLVLSLKRGRKEVAEMLLKKGCRVHKEQRNNNADTPLHLAFKTELDEIVDLILSKLNTNLVNISNSDGLSHFHIACIRNNTDVVTTFLQKSVDLNEQVKSTAKEWAGFTSLHFAVQFKCTEVLKFLLKNNADITKKNAKGMTPLHLATEEQNDAAVDLILAQHTKIWKNPVDNNELSHFHIACMKNHMKAVENFVKHGVNINHSVKVTAPKWAGYSPLHFAVKGVSVNGNSQKVMIDFLLRHKADPNSRDALNETPLHIACLLTDDNNKFTRHLNHSSSSDTESNKPVQCEKFFRIIDQIELVRIVDLLLHWDSNANTSSDIASELYLFQGLFSKLHHYCNNEVLIILLRKFHRLRVNVMKLLLHRNLEVNSKNFAGNVLLHVISDLDNVRDNIRIIAHYIMNEMDSKHDINNKIKMDLSSRMNSYNAVGEGQIKYKNLLNFVGLPVKEKMHERLTYSIDKVISKCSVENELQPNAMLAVKVDKNTLPNLVTYGNSGNAKCCFEYQKYINKLGYQVSSKSFNESGVKIKEKNDMPSNGSINGLHVLKSYGSEFDMCYNFYYINNIIQTYWCNLGNYLHQCIKAINPENIGMMHSSNLFPKWITA